VKEKQYKYYHVVEVKEEESFQTENRNFILNLKEINIFCRLGIVHILGYVC
jgi:hypothetical protein